MQKKQASQTDNMATASHVDHEEITKFKKDFYRFARKAFEYDWKIQGIFISLVLEGCNGSCASAFSQATIDYDVQKNDPRFSNFPIFLWYLRMFEYIGKELRLMESPETFKPKLKIQLLVDAIANVRKHEMCLKQLTVKDASLNEEKIKCILALHYFKPLSNDAEYYVDRSQKYRECLCGVVIPADQNKTSFGHQSVWHGHSDILVQKSIVKVVKDELAACLADCSLEEHDEEPCLSHCSTIIEVETEETKKRDVSYSQAIAEAITNAFVESRKDRSLFDKFIPSFLATEAIVRIILYNCKLDKLLVTDELNIWNIDGNLRIETMICIWVALSTYVKEQDDFYVNFILDKTPDSRFKDVVGEAAYAVYLNGVTRPLAKDYKEKLTLNANSGIMQQTVRDENHTFIQKAIAKVLEATGQEVEGLT